MRARKNRVQVAAVVALAGLGLFRCCCPLAPKQPGRGLVAPSALAFLGVDLFVANYYSSVTEVDGATRALVRVIPGPQYKFEAREP